MSKWLSSTNAKEIGTLYLVFAVFAGMIGTAFSVLIRLELAAPGVQILQGDHQLFNVIITAHAFVMSAPLHFFVLQLVVGRLASVLRALFVIIKMGFHFVIAKRYRTRDIAYQIANNFWQGVADVNKAKSLWLPTRASGPRVTTQVEVNKSDTLSQEQKEPQDLSRILLSVFGPQRYLFLVMMKIHIFKVIMKLASDIMSARHCLLAKWHSTEEEQLAQTAKGVALEGFLSSDNVNENKYEEGTWDPTACAFFPKCTTQRRRSFHSSAGQTSPVRAKESSPKSPLKVNEISNKATASAEAQLRKVISSQLDKYIDNSKAGRYNGIIRIIADASFLKACYQIIINNTGAMAKRTSLKKTALLDQKWFEQTALEMLTGRFTPSNKGEVQNGNTPLARKNSAIRKSLVVDAIREQIVLKAVQLLLEAIYELLVKSIPHAVRPHSSQHSALDTLHMRGGPFAWAIQVDISNLLAKLSHKVIMALLKNRIACVRTLTIIERALKVGSLTLFPILVKIVLHALDEFFFNNIQSEFNRGKKRRDNPLYAHYSNLRRTSRINKVDPKRRADALLQLRKLPKFDTHDPNYRRVMIVRFAGQFLILFAGPISEAVLIRNKLGLFLKDTCGLDLNIENMLVTSLRKGLIFLGALIHKRTNSGIFNNAKNQVGTSITRRSTLRLGVDAPIASLVKKLITNGFARRNHKGTVLAKGLTHLIHLGHSDILRFFNSRILAIFEFYSFAGNLSSLHRVFWILRQSCALTLARKFKLKTLRKTFFAFGFDLLDKATNMRLEIPRNLRRLSLFDFATRTTAEKIDVLLATKWSHKLTSEKPSGVCALCGSNDQVEMHHLRPVNDVRQKIRTGNITFSQWTGAVLRKQIPLCKLHHNLLHAGKLSLSERRSIARYSKESQITQKL